MDRIHVNDIVFYVGKHFLENGNTFCGICLKTNRLPWVWLDQFYYFYFDLSIVPIFFFKALLVRQIVLFYYIMGYKSHDRK